MATVPIRELRNHTAQVIERARAGETLILTANGERLARIEPLAGHRRAFLSPAEVMAIPRADAELRRDLKDLLDDTTADLGPIQ